MQIARYIDRQIDRETDIQADGQKDRQKDAYMHRWIDRYIDRQTRSQIDIQIERWMDRQVDMQICRYVDRQTGCGHIVLHMFEFNCFISHEHTPALSQLFLCTYGPDLYHGMNCSSLSHTMCDHTTCDPMHSIVDYGQSIM